MMNPIRLASADHSPFRMSWNAFDGVWRLLANIRQQVEFVHARQRQRAALGRLDERLLRDVGLTIEQAKNETAKLPWQD